MLQPSPGGTPPHQAQTVAPTPAVPQPSCFQKPFGSHWQRISTVMLLLSILQCFASIYIYLYASDSTHSRHVVFFGFLGYCAISLACMVMRAKYGLLFFGLGSLLYAIWLSVLTWQSVQEKNWTRVCFDFGITAFEFLVFCLAISRYHELRGFVLCCGEPNHDWKGRLLVGEGTTRRPRGNMNDDGADEDDFESMRYHPGGVGMLHGNEPEEGERYLNQNLLANQYFHGMPQSQQQPAQAQPHAQHPSVRVDPYATQSVPRRVVPSGHVPSHEDDDSEDMFPEAGSQISSASSSYNRSEVGRGELLYAVPTRRQEQPPPTIFDHSFKLAPVIPDQRTIHLHQQQQREALSRDPSFTFGHQ